jgi:uncharacterized protein YcgI (DUF1989 family)
LGILYHKKTKNSSAPARGQKKNKCRITIHKLQRGIKEAGDFYIIPPHGGREHRLKRGKTLKIVFGITTNQG